MVEEKYGDKLRALEELLASWGSVAVGFSGGVDSTFLAVVCARALSRSTTLFRLDTPFASTSERASVQQAMQGAALDERSSDAGVAAATALGLPLVTLSVDPFADVRVTANGRDRCYYCKRSGFTAIVHAARERRISVVADGSNADDAGDYRPGIRALRELGVRSPLMEAGWHKAEERELLREWGFPVWDMPAGACLATRIPCGEPLTLAKIEAVRACEDYLRGLGARQIRARLIDGRVYVEASAGDIAVLAVGSGTGEDGRELLLPAVADELAARCGCEVDSCLRPYVKGGMNG